MYITGLHMISLSGEARESWNSGSGVGSMWKVLLYSFFKKIIYLFIFIFGCVGSLFLCEGFL